MINLRDAPEFYHGYLSKIYDGSVVDNLVESGDKLSDWVQSISEEKGSFAYDEGKWTIKEVLQHINDSERIFAYRALRFARNDTTELSGFDQDLYALESGANKRSMASILNEFHILRASSIDLFANLNSALTRKGIANGGELTVESIGYIISGHTLHHISILKDRYLNGN